MRLHPVACPRNDLRRKLWIEVVPCLLAFFWQVWSPSYPVPSSLALPCCRFLETLLVATACSCYFLCQAWHTWAFCSVFVQRACCYTGASRWSGSITSESLEDVTCDSLGDVTWSHGTHDVRDLSERSDRSRMGKSHQKGQNCDCVPVFRPFEF